MKTCGTCKHWGKGREDHLDDRATEQTSVFRACGAVIHDREGATNEYEDAPDEGPPEDDFQAKLRAEVAAIRRHKAVVKDGSDYFAALKTRDDFGCVLHEDDDRVSQRVSRPDRP